MFRSCVTTASHPSFRSPPVKCTTCRASIPSSTPRVQVDGRWYCADCGYLAEHPDAAMIERAPRPRKPQVETLW